MKLSFSQEKYESYPQFKNGEKALLAKMYFDGKLRIMEGVLVPGASIGLHTHENNAEVIFVIEGNLVAVINNEEEQLTSGDVHYCPKGDTHTLINKSNSDALFKAVIFE
ncbi:MAG: cupin domain-containing protein [Bacilli bacterium]